MKQNIFLMLFLFFICVSVVRAETVTYGDEVSCNTASDRSDGYFITTNGFNVTLDNVTKVSAQDSTKAILYDENVTELIVVDYVGDVAIFNYTLIPNSNYFIVSTSLNDSWTMYCSAGDSSYSGTLFNVAGNYVYGIPYYNVISSGIPEYGHGIHSVSMSEIIFSSPVSCSFCNETCSPCGGGCSATDLSFMFSGITDFDNVVGNISGWDTSCVTNMEALFIDSDFNQDISGWDTSSVTRMGAMFSNDVTSNVVFNQPLNSWNISSVSDLDSMFYNNVFFNQPLNNWDTSSVTDMSFMFYGATSFNQDISSWNFNSVTTMADMFGNGAGLSTLNYDSLLVALAGQSNNLVSIVTANFGTSTFSSGSQSSRDLLVNQNLWSISDGGLASSPVTLCFVPSATCTPCSAGLDGLYNMTDLSFAFVGNNLYDTQAGNISGWNTSCITNMSNMFYGAISMSSFGLDLSGWDTSSVTDMSFMFSQSDFNQDISGWDTSKVTTMNGMFTYDAVFNQPIGSWNTSSVTDMQGMFQGQSSELPNSFNQDISGWDTSKVTNMQSMFGDDPVFNQNLASWNVESVGEFGMADMFYGVNLSTSYYDSMLNSWASQNVLSGVLLNAGFSQYSSVGQVGRDLLVNSYNWTIVDGGCDGSCIVCSENWHPIYGSCSNNQFLTTFVDSNNCNTTIHLPASNGSLTACVPTSGGRSAGGSIGSKPIVVPQSVLPSATATPVVPVSQPSVLSLVWASIVAWFNGLFSGG